MDLPSIPSRARCSFVLATALAATLSGAGCGWFCRMAGYSRDPRPTLPDEHAGPPVERFRTERGPLVLVLARSASPELALQIWSPRGSADEPDDAPGLAATCAELVCEAARPPAGVRVTSWAGHDATVCELVAPAGLRERAVAHAAGLLRFDRAEAAGRIEPVRAELVERWRRSRDEPRRLLLELLFATAFGRDHPYGRPVLRRPAGLGGGRAPATAERCAEWFAPADLTVAAVGDLGAEALGRELTAGRPWPPAAPAPPVRGLPDPPRRGPRADLVTVPAGSGPLVAVAFGLGPLEPEEVAALEVLAAALASGPASRLGRSGLGRTGAVGSLDGFVYAGRQSLLVVTASLDRLDAPSAVRAIAAQALVAARDPLSPAEVERARRAVLASDAAAAGPAATARRLGRAAVLAGDPGVRHRWLRALAGASPDSVLGVARERVTIGTATAVLLTPEHLRGQADGPLVVGEGGEERVDGERLRDELHAALSGAAELVESASRSECDGSLCRVEVESGPVVLVSPTAPDGVAGLAAGFPGATAWRTERRSGAPALIAALLATEWEEQAPWPVASGPEVTFGHDALTVSASSLAEEASPALASLTGSLLWPTLEPGALDRLRGELTARAIEASLDGAALALDLALRTLHSGRYRIPVAGTVEGLDTLDLRQVARTHGLVARPDRLVLVVAGPLAPEAAARAAVVAVASAPPRPEPPVETPSVTALPAETGRELRAVADTPRTHVVAGFASGGAASAGLEARTVLAELLDRGPLSAARALERDGLALSTAVAHVEAAESGHLLLLVESDPANEAAVVAAVREVFSRLRAAGVPEGALLSARGRAAGRAASRLGTARGLAEALLRAELRGGPPSVALALPERLLAVSPADLAEAAGRLLAADNGVLVVVGPEAGGPWAAEGSPTSSGASEGEADEPAGADEETAEPAAEEP